MNYARKTTPRVEGGRVLRKNRHATTAPDHYALGSALQIVRHAPGPGRVHVVDEHDIRRFLALLPDWATLGRGIRAIVLGGGDGDFDGCYRHDGVVFLRSWPRAIVQELSLWYYEAHRDVFERIGVSCDVVESPTVDRAVAPDRDSDVARGLAPPPGPPPSFARCWFEPSTARDFMLLHVFLHELGHHHDRRTLRPRARFGRGEDYAEAWAIERERVLWNARYRGTFPRR
jgi:hypothetical protein